MKLKNVGKIFLGPFITSIVVLVIIIISVIFAAVSQTNGTVQKSTGEHAISDMKSNSETYAKSIWFDICSGITDMNSILESDTYLFKLVFVTDSDGTVLAASQIGSYTVSEKNLFDHFRGGKYVGDTDEETARRQLKNGETGNVTIQMNRKEYLVYRRLGDGDLRFFYMLHQSDVERLYAESEKYLKTVRSLGFAYVTATLGLVILMGSYIFFVAKSSEFKLYMSNMRARSAQEQARTYSDITRVLSQSYEKIYYVNLANDHYRVFTSSPNGSEAPVQSEGEDFWHVVVDNITASTVEEDRERVGEFLDKNSLLETVRDEGRRRARFRMLTGGAETYYSASACLTESEGQRYLILGLKDVDAVVLHDMKQLAEKDAALRRMEIYRSALLDNMLAFLEVNLNDGMVVEGPIIVDDNNEMRHIDLSSMPQPVRYDDLAQAWSERFVSSEQEKETFLNEGTCARFRREYEKGRSIVEFNYDSEWFDGSIRFLRQNVYLSKRERNGSVEALCVLYDMTEKISRDREIRNLTEELNQSRIKISTGQMQPHFLYNVLGSIREIILEDPQYASDLICDFTTHLRACIKSLSNDDLVPFAKEVENIRAYVNIERMRFGSRMEVDFDIQYDDFDMVPLSIQPLVENAIRHGLFPKRNGKGIVKISTFCQNGFIVIVVKDNGVGFDYEKVNQEIREHKRDSTGLLNLTLRLEKVMHAKVYFDSKIGEGTTVTILIPEKKEG